MEELRLPWSNREGILYGGVIALITAFLMATLNISMSFGRIDSMVLANSVTCLPVIWVIVMLLMTLFVGRVANAGVRRFTEPTDGFNTRIVFNIIFCVLMMSMIMTLVGPLVGEILSGSVTWHFISEWPSRWPTNFCAAFWIEMLLAQPAARALMKRIHLRKLASTGGAAVE